jgi:hypothetical protein
MRKRLHPDLAAIVAMQAEAEQRFLEIGRRLVDASEKRKFLDWGFTSMGAALKAAGLERRKAAYWMRIARDMRKHALRDADVSGCTWGALKEVVVHFTGSRQKNLKLLQRARRGGVLSLHDTLKSGGAETITVSAAVRSADKRLWEDCLALKNGGKLPKGLRSRGATLAAILREWKKLKFGAAAKQAA